MFASRRAWRRHETQDAFTESFAHEALLSTDTSYSMPASTQAVLWHHLHAFYQGIDPLMEDFTDDSVVISHDATSKSLAEIRTFFAGLIQGLPEGFADAGHHQTPRDRG
jgi:hypothetical protein